MKYIGWFFVGVVSMLLVLSLLFKFDDVFAHRQPYYRFRDKCEATVYNTMPWSAKIELKCDWDGKRWKIHKKNLPLKGHSSLTISVPNGSRCQLWPSLW